jgi:hypothetical protein
MDVENYTTDLMQWNATRNCRVIKRQRATFCKRKYARIIREAKRDFLSGFGIDWSLFDEGVLIFDDMQTCQAEFTHKSTGQKFVLNAIWFDPDNGAILQAGMNHGNLEM